MLNRLLFMQMDRSNGRALVRRSSARSSAAEQALVGFHPEGHDRAKQEQGYAADERQVPIVGPLDDITGEQRRNGGGERRTDIHQAAGGTGKIRSDVHRDGPEGADGELREKEGGAEAD